MFRKLTTINKQQYKHILEKVTASFGVKARWTFIWILLASLSRAVLSLNLQLDILVMFLRNCVLVQFLELPEKTYCLLILFLILRLETISLQKVVQFILNLLKNHQDGRGVFK